MDELYRLETVLKIVDKKQGSWRALVKAGKAPSPIYLGSRSPRWKKSDLQNYLEDPSLWEKNHKVS